MNPVEIAAAACTLAYVLLAARGSILCWPFGITGAVLYIIFDFQLKYYQDALLQCYYVIAGFYGWYWWGKQKTDAAFQVVSLPVRRMIAPLCGCALLVLPIGYFFSKLGNAYSYLDAATTIFSFLATWLTARIVLQSWLLWIVVDAVLAVQFLLKDARITFGLYLLMAAMAVYGYLKWKQELSRSQAPRAPAKPH